MFMKKTLTLTSPDFKPRNLQKTTRVSRGKPLWKNWGNPFSENPFRVEPARLL